jgi:hypothetical protein
VLHLCPDTNYTHTVQIATVSSEIVTLRTVVHARTPPPPEGNSLIYTARFAAPASASRASVVSTAPGERLETPWYPVQPGPCSITVVGLKSETTYAHTVRIATVSSETLALPPVEATTPPLPRDISSFAMVVSGTAPRGYLLFGGTLGHVIAFDEKGTCRWYRQAATELSLSAHPTQEWKMQYDGSMTAFVGSSRGWEPERGEFVRFTPQGKTLARYSQASDPTEPGNPALYTDPHELQITRDDSGHESLHYLAYVLRPTGAQGEPAAWHELLRTTPGGQVLFRWKAWEHILETDQVETLPGRDVDHPNSLEIAPDGNYVVSFRNTNEVMKVDSRTGAVLWRFGGVHNQFRIEGDPWGGCYGQHSVRVLENGNLLLFDNGLRHEPPESRAVEYAIDAQARTATMVFQYRHTPPIFEPYVGSVQRLTTDGETIVAFALVGTVCGVDREGRLLWEAQVTHYRTPAKAYRVRHVPSLYAVEER